MDPDALCECGHARDDHNFHGCIWCYCDYFNAAEESAKVHTPGGSDER